MVQSPLINKNLISDPDVPESPESGLEGRTEPPESIVETLVKKITPSNFDLVRDWHTHFGINDPDSPVFRDDRQKLRLDLISEEYIEITEALDNRDMPNLAKELADLLWVTYGMAAEYGIDIDRVFKEVYRSNMSKLDEDGKPILREDGKILKSSLYEEADLSWIEENN